jgi:plasmid stabilization system protein ParE
MSIFIARTQPVLATGGQPVKLFRVARHALFQPYGDAGMVTGGPTGERAPPRETAASHADAERARIAAAIESALAGRLVLLADMQEWLDSLQSDHVLPLPRARRWADRMTQIGATSLTDEAAQSLGQIEWWYAQPGAGAAGVAARRVRSILATIARLGSTPEGGLPGPVPGTREITCNQHRIVHWLQAPDGAEVVRDLLGPAHQ